MAREIVNRQVNIYIQSGEAQKAYDKLIAKEKTLNAELAKTTDPKKMAKLKEDLSKLVEPLDRAAKKISGELNPSLKDTAATVQKLKNQLSRMSDGDAGFDKMTQQLRQGNKELDQQRQKVGLISKAWKSFWSEAKTVAAGVIIGNTLQSALQTVLGYVTGIITGSAKIADEMSDIEKTTGLTTEEVRSLNKELGKIDTRTSRSELRKLAAEGGKLGFETSAELLKFVDAADKIKVALKEDLGEGAILDIAKTSKIFQVEMLNMASAINEVGASSSASEAFAVDFLKRTGGVAATVKIAAGDVLGYSSAIEQAGLTTEVSTTALNTFFLDFVSGADKFGKAAGFATGELGKLINEKGTNEAFLQWLTRLKQIEPTAAGFINKLKDIGIDGARGSNVILTLAKNIEEVRKQQLIANDAIKSSDSIMNEFNKKNTNAAAELEKFKKNLAGLFQSESLQSAGRNAVQLLNGFVNLVKASINFVREHGLVVGILSAFYALFVIRIKGATIAQIAWNLVTRAGTVFTNIARAALVAYTIASAVLTRQIGAAAGAQLIWAAATKTGAGAIGGMLVVIGALAIGVVSLFTKTKQLNAEQRITNEIEKKASESYAGRIATVKQLIALASNESISLKNRQKALEEVKKASDGYLKNLTLENIETEKGTNLIKNYIQFLRLSAKAKAVAELSKDKEKRKIDIETELDILNSRKDSKSERGAAAFVKNLFAGKGGGTVGNQIRDLRTELSGVDSDLEALYAKIEKDGSLQEAIVNGTGTGDVNGGGGSPIAQVGRDAKDMMAELLRDIKKFQDEAKISNLSGLDKELSELDTRYNALRERIGKNQHLLLIVQKAFNTIRFNMIQEFARKEVEAWGRAGDEANKKATEVFLKNLEFLKRAAELLSQGGDDRIKNITAKFLQEQWDKEDLDKAILKEKTDFYIGYLQNIANITSIADQAKTDRENAELEADRRRNDIKKNNLDRRLKSGAISQLMYDRELQKIEREQQRREKEIAIKQFRRQQRADVVQALINGAMAVTSTLAAKPGAMDIATFGVFRAIQLGLVIATTAAQVAAIATKKPPEYAQGGKYSKGGKLNGRYHSQGGNPILDGSGRKIGEIEKDEGIINRFSMGDRRRYTVSGTPSQIGSAINGLHGGRTWETGAKLRPAWAYTKPMPMNFNAIHRYYAAGGKYNATKNTNQTTDTITPVIESLVTVIADMQQTLAAIQTNGISAYTLLSQQEKAQDRLAAIREDATMRG